jgi:hypothetical protein
LGGCRGGRTTYATAAQCEHATAAQRTMGRTASQARREYAAAQAGPLRLSSERPRRALAGATSGRPLGGQAAPPVMGLGLEAIQGMTNAMNVIANQVIRNSGRFGRNAGWPYFDGTFRDYPAFKRKFESFQMTYHRGTPTRELFQQFREMCLPEKLSAKIKSANTMENAWVRLEAWFGDKALFIKDLMQDIKGVAPIKEGNDERMMDYYVTLQAHIEEACSADALDMLLIPANVELMVLPLTT